MSLTNAKLVFSELRLLLLPWGMSLLFPMPMLLVGGESASSDLATLYIGIGAAWLVGEAFRRENKPPQSACRARIFAVLVFLAINVLAFWVMGGIGPIQSNIPWPLLCFLAVIPAVGLIPWLVLRIGHPHAALVVAGLIVGSIKICGCIVARIVYGPDFIALGYVSADWTTAKLMISVMWGGTILVSALTARLWYRELVPSL